MAPPGLPTIQTAFLSAKPLEPVLVFSSAEEALRFQDKVRQGRIYPNESQAWVYVPLPDGLLRARTTRGGDIAFDFDSPSHADRFNQSIKKAGRIFSKTHVKSKFDQTVYIGKTSK